MSRWDKDRENGDGAYPEPISYTRQQEVYFEQLNGIGIEAETIYFIIIFEE